MSGNLRFDSFTAHHGAKYLITGPKIESFLHIIYPISTYFKFEVNWISAFLDNARKPSFGRTDADQRYIPSDFLGGDKWN